MLIKTFESKTRIPRQINFEWHSPLLCYLPADWISLQHKAFWELNKFAASETRIDSIWIHESNFFDLFRCFNELFPSQKLENLSEREKALHWKHFQYQETSMVRVVWIYEAKFAIKGSFMQNAVKFVSKIEWMGKSLKLCKTLCKLHKNFTKALIQSSRFKV